MAVSKLFSVAPALRKHTAMPVRLGLGRTARHPCKIGSVHHGWRNRGGGGGPSPPCPINSISWVGPGGTRYIPKWALFTSFGLFFSNCNSCIGGFGPFATLKDPFPRGTPRPSPLTSRIISPALCSPGAGQRWSGLDLVGNPVRSESADTADRRGT